MTISSAKNCPELVRYINADACISDWTKSHANFFRAVQIEKNMMFIILSLIAAVVAFNLVFDARLWR